MNAPLGRTVGNAIETREALEVLHGRGRADLVECTYALGTEMLVLGQVARSREEARELLRGAVASGKAVEVMARMVAAQGGDPAVVEKPRRLSLAPVAVEIEAPRSGFVTGIDALEIGLAAVAMGAGRTRADQAVDPAVGIEIAVTRGQRVDRGTALGFLYVRREEDAEAVRERVRGAFVLGDRAEAAPALVLGRIG
jgi:pyrimidine-nucleoside phosphorylase